MPEKKRNYDADTLSISNLKLSRNQEADGMLTGKTSSRKGSIGKSGGRNTNLTRELIQRIIEKMKES